MGPKLTEYRAYTIDKDGRIKGRFDLTAIDEPAARVQAKRLVDGHDVELWLGEKRLETFRHKL